MTHKALSTAVIKVLFDDAYFHSENFENCRHKVSEKIVATLRDFFSDFFFRWDCALVVISTCKN